MKTSMNELTSQISPAIIAKGYRAEIDQSSRPIPANKQPGTSVLPVLRKSKTPHRNLLTTAAVSKMINGTIPNLWEPCIALYRSLHQSNNSNSALEFVPVLQQLSRVNETAIERFKRSKETSCVLVENDMLKVVLIHWPSGKIGSIHGHPKGGGVFKILQGSVEELRYTSHVSPKLLATSVYHSGSISYIDDTMGLHAVGNPFNTSAVTLHAYTRGRNINMNS